MSRPIFLSETRPKNIMPTTTSPMSMAVERFSSMMRKMSGQVMVSTYLKVFSSVPSSVCMALRICATARTMVPLAISEGWNCRPKSDTHRWAPLVLCPAISTHRRVMAEMISRKMVAILKYLQSMFCTTTMMASPARRMPPCLMMGPQ